MINCIMIAIEHYSPSTFGTTLQDIKILSNRRLDELNNNETWNSSLKV